MSSLSSLYVCMVNIIYLFNKKIILINNNFIISLKSLINKLNIFNNTLIFFYFF